MHGGKFTSPPAVTVRIAVGVVNVRQNWGKLMLDNPGLIAYNARVRKCRETVIGTSCFNISIWGASSWALKFLDLT